MTYLNNTYPIDHLDWALLYASRGWLVFPLHHPTSFGSKDGPDRATCSCRNDKCTSQGKHPRTLHGANDASRDPETITAWWRRWPEANIGLVTGVFFDVLDIDGPEAEEAIRKADPAGTAALEGPRVSTGRGRHVYVQPTGRGNPTNAGGLAGVDWRGKGGYVVAPPSLHYSGTRYEWTADAGMDAALSVVPDWLAGLLAPPVRLVAPRAAYPIVSGLSYGQTALRGECERLLATPEGSRNDQLNRSAFRLGQLVHGGSLDPLEAAETLRRVSAQIGLGDSEATRTIVSGLRSGMSNPRGGVK